MTSPPSRNPVDNDSMTGMLRVVLTKFLQGVDDMLPARVIAYDRPSNRAMVQPLIAVVTTDNQQVARAQVASVPVLQLGGGGFVLSFPVSTGDLGWIKANDRDISLFKSTYANSPPNTQRKHDFADALFIPDTMLQGVTIASEDAANAVLQNDSGTVRLAIWPTLFKFTAPQVGIGDSPGYTPNPNAILDVQSTTKAFCPPRMTTGQRNAIPSPSEGMTIYNLDMHSLQTYTNTGWP
jgi:hypothetical protein